MPSSVHRAFGIGASLLLAAISGAASDLDERLREDWRKQDGIGTPQAPATYRQAIEKTLRLGDLLKAELEASGHLEPDLAERWDRVRTDFERALARGSLEGAEGERIWLRARRARRAMLLSLPEAKLGPVVFAKQVPSIFSHQLTQYYGSCARPGGGIFVLERPGLSMECVELTRGKFPPGSFQHPEVSFDGKKILFAYCRAETVPPDRESHLDRFYHLYEFYSDGSVLRQLTDGPYDDFSPKYLPDGRIVFVSTRRGGFHRCGRGPCPVYTLAVCNADGSDPRPISYHETHEWDPALLLDGRIIYTRWDYVDRHAVFYQQLWSVRPDGTDPRIFYGNATFNPVGIWEARPIPGTTRVIATAAAHHAMTAGSIIAVEVGRGVDGPGPIARLTPDALFPESEVPVARLGPGHWFAQVGAPEFGETPEEARRWPGHCYRSPYPLSERCFLVAYSFDPLIGEPDPNPANMFGLYIADRFGNKELLYRDPEIASLWPVPLAPRAKPPVLPSQLEAGTSEGRFLLQDVYRAWPPLEPGSVRRLRIIQVLPKSTPHANDPPVGLPNASPGKQVLGTVPVEPDGSAHFSAPARIPLSFQALDARGEAIQIMRSVTYLQPGEVQACIGCHEPRSTAPPPRAPLAAAREPSRIEPAPEGSKPLSYPILVQPVLDRHCVRCHGGEKAEGGAVLTGEPAGLYTKSYLALAPLVSYSDWAGRPGDFRVVNCEPITQPGFFGAKGSRLAKLLREGHHDVELSDEDWERLVTWMDANALFYGTFDRADQERQRRGEKIAGPAIE